MQANGREQYSPVDTQQGYRMPSSLPEPPSMRHGVLVDTVSCLLHGLVRSSSG